jgi:hypothetical protein
MSVVSLEGRMMLDGAVDTIMTPPPAPVGVVDPKPVRQETWRDRKPLF